MACGLSGVSSDVRITSCKFLHSKNQCKFLLFYLAVVAFSRHQGSCCMHGSLFWFVSKNVWNHCFHHDLKHQLPLLSSELCQNMSRRSELRDTLIFSKDCWQSTDQFHLMSLLNSLLTGALIWRCEGRKLPLWLTNPRNGYKLLMSDGGGMRWIAATLAGSRRWP